MRHLMAAIVAAGIASTGAPACLAQDGTGLVGPINSDTTLPYIANPNPWYGAVQVSVDFDDTKNQSKIFEGPRARSFWKRVESFFNVTTGAESYVVVVEPSINDVKLPPLPIITIKRDDKDGTKLTIERAITSITPNVPISGGSTVGYKISYTAVRGGEISLFREGGKLATTLAAAPGWALSAALQPVVNTITAGLDKGMQNLRNFNLSSSASEQFSPFEGMRQYVVWRITDLDLGQIAVVRIELKTRRTLREPPLSMENDSALPAMNTTLLADPAYRVLRAGPAWDPVRTVLANDAVLSKTLREATTVDGWVTACKDLFGKVQNAGFNVTDTTVITVRLLQDESPLPSRRELQTALWSQCLPNYKPLAQKLGLETYPEATDHTPPRSLSFDTIGDVAQHVLAAGGDAAMKERARSVLAGALLWDGEPLDQEGVLAKLAKLGGWTKYHCTNEAYPKQEADGARRRGATVMLWNGNKPDVVLALYGPKDAEPGKPAQLIEVRPPTSQEFTDCERYEKKARPDSPLLPRRDVVTASK